MSIHADNPDKSTGPAFDAALLESGGRSETVVVSGTVAVAAGKTRLYNDSDVTRKIKSVRVSANTAPTGADLVVDVHKDGTTIFTTQANRPKIAAGANTGLSGAPAVTAWEPGKYLTVDVDVVGSTVAGADLTVSVNY